jgi:XapX domain-containing protein
MTWLITLSTAFALGAIFGLLGLQGPIPPSMLGAFCVPAMTLGYLFTRWFL